MRRDAIRGCDIERADAPEWLYRRRLIELTVSTCCTLRQGIHDVVAEL